MKRVETYEESLKDHPEKKAAYDKVEELVRKQDIKFDDTDRNKELLEKSILERGYSPDGQGSWIPNLDAQENSIKMIAQWEKKFQERMLKLGAVEYMSLDKIKKRSMNKIDMTNSSFFTNSVVLTDEYDHPKTVLFNVSRMTGAMEFTGNGLGAQESYEIAALNARRNNWKTVTLQYNGDPEQGVKFIKNSILALIDGDIGNYSLDDIRVPKKYANVLKKIREQTAIVSESPQPGTEKDYVSGNEVSNANEQELKNANQLTGQDEEEPSGGPGPGGGGAPNDAESENTRASNNREEGGGGSGGGSGGEEGGGAAADMQEPPVVEGNAHQNEPEEQFSAIDDELYLPERDEEAVQQLYAQADNEMANADALEQGAYDDIDYGSEAEVRDALAERNTNKNDPPLVAGERAGYRPVRGKKK